MTTARTRSHTYLARDLRKHSAHDWVFIAVMSLICAGIAALIVGNINTYLHELRTRTNSDELAPASVWVGVLVCMFALCAACAAITYYDMPNYPKPEDPDARKHDATFKAYTAWAAIATMLLAFMFTYYPYPGGNFWYWWVGASMAIVSILAFATIAFHAWDMRNTVERHHQAAPAAAQ